MTIAVRSEVHVPVYFDKSVRAGPCRFDILPHGAGIASTSALAKLGIQPRAHFIKADAGGFSYRASKPSMGLIAARPVDPLPPSRSVLLNNVRMLAVDSSDVLGMRDEGFAAVLDEINFNQQTEQLAIILPFFAILIAFAASYFLALEFIALVLAAPIVRLLGNWIDAYRRATVLIYELSDETEGAFRRLTEAFDLMTECAGKWHIEAGGAVTDLSTWKRHAGAGHIVQRSTTALSYALPAVIKSNVTPPALQVGRQMIYFFPDVALIEDGSTFGAVAYADLRIHWQTSDSIEAGEIPSDAYVVSYTWEHPNRGGGPDRRFRENRQLPVCRYEALHISSPNGVNELLEFSRLGIAQPFATAIASLARTYVGARPSTSYGSYGNELSLTWRSPI